MSTLHTYLPQDRARALARGETLPEHTRGAALFADISGFTALTEMLTRELGTRRGIEALAQQINTVYDALIGAIERYAGSVLGFAGDAITCWFDGDDGLRAVTAALALQAAMRAFPTLSLKVAVTSGPARRFVVGDPEVCLLDTLSGAAIARLADGEHLALPGEVLMDAATAATLAEHAHIDTWRASETGARFAVVTALAHPPAPTPPPADAPQPTFGDLLGWVLPAVFMREQSGYGDFLTELRPAVAFFLRFTGIAYDTDARAGEKLNAFVVRVQAVLKRYEGVLLDLTIGDKGSYLYAVFGAPTVHEDDARRAVQTALDLQVELAELDFLQPVQIGISQGIMRTGAYGGTTRRTYGSLGEEVNLAARLMTAARPGEVLISRAVQKTLGTEFAYLAYAPLSLKGKAEPVPVFAVTRRPGQRAHRLEELQYALPMVGRQTELALLDAKLALAAQGQGQVIGITAEAGMGKSRLVAEVIRLARARGFTGYGGTCESSGMQTPYLVWKPIWQAFFEVDPALPLAWQTRRLTELLAVRAPTRVAALPVLGIVLDLPLEDNAFTRALEPQDRRNVLTALLEACLQTAAAAGPLLLVLEDLHWLDALSHDLLETLARVSATLPVCFVLAYRPPDNARLRAPRIEGLPHFTRVALEHLSAAESAHLIGAKLAQRFPAPAATVPPALIAALTARAEGNPFYLEELLNYMHDRGISPFDESHLHELDLPANLHALILSRIDRLSETQQVTLKTASIIGRVFRATWLHGYYPALGTPDRVRDDLTALAQVDLTPLDSPEPELAYLFKHIVTHEVAYESLPYSTRAQLHEQFAHYIETQVSARLLDLLAFHYCHSTNHVKQREYLHKAGLAAQAAFANDAALDYCARLLPLLEEPTAQVDLHLRWGRVLQLLGQWDAGEAHYQEALVAARLAGDASQIAHCHYSISRTCRLRGAHAQALEWLAAARTQYLALNDAHGVVQVLNELGYVLWRTGEYARARDELEEALTRARDAGDLPGEAEALNFLGIVAGAQKDFAAARTFYSECLLLNRALHDKLGTARVLNNLAIMTGNQGDYASARTWYIESLALNREIGNKWGVSMTLSNSGVLALKQGDFAEARARLREGLAAQRALGDKWGMIYSFTGLAGVALHSGDADVAVQLAAVAEALRAELQTAMRPDGRALYEATLAGARAALTEAQFEQAWAAGARLTVEEALALG